jgi:8-oxo-dGTP diphosphatase
MIAQAVVLRAGNMGTEVLLVHRTSPRAWELPGGEVESGEEPRQTAIRETREETGLIVQVERQLGWYRRTGFRPHRSPVYVCHVFGGSLRPNWESVAVRWFPVDRLPLGLFPWYRSIIQDAAHGVTYLHEQRQHLGVRATAAGTAIHFGSILGLVR